MTTTADPPVVQPLVNGGGVPSGETFVNVIPLGAPTSNTYLVLSNKSIYQLNLRDGTLRRLKLSLVYDQ